MPLAASDPLAPGRSRGDLPRLASALPKGRPLTVAAKARVGIEGASPKP